MPKKFKVVAVGAGDPGRPPVLVGFLKTYVESRPQLKGRVSVDVVPLSDYSGMENVIMAGEPDLVVFSPHEDWDNKSMFAVCARLKASKPGLPVVTCGETPRNRIQFTEAFRDGLVDFVIHGEGEAPLSELITHLLDGHPPVEKVRGLTYMRKGSVRRNEKHPAKRKISAHQRS